MIDIPHIFICIYLCQSINQMKASSHIYSIEAGDNVTFVDESYSDSFFMGMWFFNITKPSPCYSSIQQNAKLNELCQIYYGNTYYPVQQFNLNEHCKTYFNYTCNETSLHLYNISENAPTTYWLQKLGRPQKNITFYYLNITSKTSTIFTTQLEYFPPPPLNISIFYNPVIQ
ncbi:RL11 Family [Baboon cytomegalovirus]|nr:RL11 Family [Baboon cytomegalovirus]